jgi:hypothetical protein
MDIDYQGQVPGQCIVMTIAHTAPLNKNIIKVLRFLMWQLKCKVALINMYMYDVPVLDKMHYIQHTCVFLFSFFYINFSQYFFNLHTSGSVSL